MIISAVAFGVGALCLYYGARDLRTRRAIRRLNSKRDARRDAPSGRADASIDRPDGLGVSDPVDPPEDTGEDIAIERGFVLLALSGLCLLFGVLAL